MYEYTTNMYTKLMDNKNKYFTFKNNYFNVNY